MNYSQLITIIIIIGNHPIKVEAKELIAEQQRMWEKAKKIVDHGINVFINRQLIYNLPEEFFAQHGVMSIGLFTYVLTPQNHDHDHDHVVDCQITHHT